jgi:hypothetical protein
MSAKQIRRWEMECSLCGKREEAFTKGDNSLSLHRWMWVEWGVRTGRPLDSDGRPIVEFACYQERRQKAGQLDAAARGVLLVCSHCSRDKSNHRWVVDLLGPLARKVVSAVVIQNAHRCGKDIRQEWEKVFE